MYVPLYAFRYLPKNPVRYPAALSQVASVAESSNAGKPPKGGSFVQTPVVWEYFPVSNVVRLGQQRGLLTNAFVKVIPRSTSWACTVGIAQRESQRWSSVRTMTIVGGSAARAGSGLTATRARTIAAAEASRRGNPIPHHLSAL